MKDAGLTHGGFYGHFASKEALAAEAVALRIRPQRGRGQSDIDRPGRARVRLSFRGAIAPDRAQRLRGGGPWRRLRPPGSGVAQDPDRERSQSDRPSCLTAQGAAAPLPAVGAPSPAMRA